MKREAERRSHDLFRIVNPTTHDYPIIFDGRYAHVVPSSDKDVGYGKGQLVVERHIAHKYVNEMAWKIISAAIDFEINRINGVRKKKGMPQMTKYQGGEEEQEGMRLMNEWEKKTPELWKTLCLGKVSDYGILNVEGRKVDDKAPHEIAVEEMENTISQPSIPTVTTDTMVDKKEELLKGVEE